MPITKPNQQLHLDLKEAAAILKWSGVELMRIAERLSVAGNEADAQAVLRMCTVFHDGEDRLVGYAAEVEIGLVTRVKAG